MPARDSELRAFLLRYAQKRGLLVKEHVSEPAGGGLAGFYCHIQAPGTVPLKSATAISYEGRDNALVMAFLNYGNHELDFILENL